MRWGSEGKVKGWERKVRLGWAGEGGMEEGEVKKGK